MKKLLIVSLICVMLFSFTGCKKSNQEENNIVNGEKDHFEELTDNVVNAIEDNDNLSELKTEVKDIKKEILDTVSNASEEEKTQYDVKQIAIFMLEKAIDEYEIAQKNDDKTKMTEAKANIEMAKKIWSSSDSDY